MTSRNFADISVMATTGQQLFIRYDAATNAMVFSETDWHADPVRTGVLPRTQLSERLKSATVTRLVPRTRPLIPGPRAA